MRSSPTRNEIQVQSKKQGTSQVKEGRFKKKKKYIQDRAMGKTHSDKARNREEIFPQAGEKAKFAFWHQMEDQEELK